MSTGPTTPPFDYRSRVHMKVMKPALLLPDQSGTSSFSLLSSEVYLILCFFNGWLLDIEK